MVMIKAHKISEEKLISRRKERENRKNFREKDMRDRERDRDRRRDPQQYENEKY